MRQAQNSKRARGRNRKVVNQMSRTLDSNGPDVKIRGTASHIYEKYQTLARDANSSGDRVMAENYLQHAEHYFRLINAMQAASQAQAQPGANGATASDAGKAAEAAPAGDEAAESPADAAAPRSRANGRGRRRSESNRGNGSGAQSKKADVSAPELPLTDKDRAAASEAKEAHA